MTPQDETFFYATELDGDDPPTFADARSFSFDRYQHGEPTAYKLAKVAAPIEYARINTDDPVASWYSDRRRFFFWNSSGQSYGSIEVDIEYEPRFAPLAKTVKRASAPAA